MTEWMPIESAPRDGRMILVADICRDVRLMFWSPNAGRFLEGNDRGGLRIPEAFWMPLPTAPNIPTQPRTAPKGE